MPNPRMNAAKMKAEALKKAKANKMKSKMGSPTNKTGKAKPAAAVKNAKVYKKIKSTSTYKPKFEKVSDEKLEMASPAKMSGRSYDMKMAYDKKLTPKARLHYLENERHDAPGKMKGSPYHKHGSPYHMNNGDSPMHKDLVGNQKNLPEHLKKKIKAFEPAPQMKGSPYHMSNELKYGGPVIDQMKTLSQAGASKVLRHMKK
jgi:hypothetical protein